MKKTLFLLAIGFGCLSITSCARGYGCPYTTEAKATDSKIEIEKNSLYADQAEALDAVLIAD